MKPIYLLGVNAPQELMDGLAPELGRVFRTACATLGNSLDAGFAYDSRRGQYYSSAILQRLQQRAPGGARILGVTELDLYVPVLTFVFGEAQLGGDCAVISSHRLREEFYGLPAREDLFRERLLKEAVHELGHTFGLRHCDDWRCVMTSSHAVERLDVKSVEFCGECRKAIL